MARFLFASCGLGSGLVTRVTLNLDGNGDSVEKHTNNFILEYRTFFKAPGAEGGRLPHAFCINSRFLGFMTSSHAGDKC